ncbi:type II secretion system F family protein [Candidatus Pacearchaeota archaeon]|nr:type II secretion system F family protein [Candidatus Pacearchaeota archaeon]
MKIENLIKELKNNVEKEKKVVRELNILYKHFIKLKGDEEKKMVSSQLQSLKKHLKESNNRASRNLRSMYLAKPLPNIAKKAESKTLEKKETKIVPVDLLKQPIITRPQSSDIDVILNPTNRKKLIKLDKMFKLEGLEKETLKRLKKKSEKVKKEKEKKPNNYAKKANRFFSKNSIKLLDKKMFKTLERDLIKANLQYTPTTYISMIFYTTFLSILVGIFLTAFFLFFKIGAELPIVTLITENLNLRILKVIWLLIATPAITFLIMYIYPSLEKKSTAHRIDHELPFAAINMAAISGSLIDPSKIFNIIITTKEYPHLSKEFTKIMNEINIHGYNFVGALRNASFNSPSKKLSELFSGLATTINSGGDLPNFFDERSKSLLFDHRLEMEKQAKSAETFMDIYISLVVAAPMILMLLLIMMKISGLGIAMSTNTITLIMVLGVSIINIVFLAFLELKKD